MKVPMADKEARKASMTKPSEEGCKVCHTPEGNPNFKEFVYKDKSAVLADHLPKP
jgi:hypothetical protein